MKKVRTTKKDRVLWFEHGQGTAAIAVHPAEPEWIPRSNAWDPENKGYWASAGDYDEAFCRPGLTRFFGKIPGKYPQLAELNLKTGKWTLWEPGE